MIWFETHSTSIDNEAGIASGHSDPPLSLRGQHQAAEVGPRHSSVRVVWCSDLQRSYRTAEIAFGARVSIRKDPRLREIDFGDLTRAQSAEIDPTRTSYIDMPYPNGESYVQVCSRVKEFLHAVADVTEPQLIIGHRATWYALEHLINGRHLQEIMSAPWRWQPGWRYPAVFS